MAQERGRANGARRLAGRYGVACGLGTALAVCAALAGVTAIGGLGRGAVEIGRGAPEEPAGQSRGEADAEGAAASEGAGASTDDEAPALVVVHVDGAVAVPGVYVLPQGSRAADAVDAAGGLVEGADTSSVNLAAPVGDGEKVRIPTAGEAAAPGGDGAGDGGAAGPVNINSADVGELDELPGVGEATARAIVEDREKNGPFASVEDLMRVSGIGEKKFERLAGLICV